MSRRNLISLLLGIMVLYYLTSFIRIHFGDQWNFLPDFVYILAPLFATIMGFWAVKIFGLNKQGMPILFLSLGIASYLIAEIIFVIIDDFTGLETTPSLADLFYLLAYPLFFIGLVKKIVSEGAGFSFKKNFVFIILAIAFIALFSYFSIYSAFDPQESFIKNSILASYGIGDIILSVCCLFLLVITYEYEGGRMSYSWLILNTSFLVTLICDLFYAIYPNEYSNIIPFRIILDTLYILSYFLFALAMHHFIGLVKEKQEFLKKELANQG